MLPSILQAYGLDEKYTRVEAFGNGLINDTWKVTSGNKEYILQRINNAVFKQPEHIAHNIKVIAYYLKEHYPTYKFIAPILTTGGDEMNYLPVEGFFRLFPFVANSHSRDVVGTPEQAYEAAMQFGRFTRLLSGLEVSKLKTTIPGFHDLSFRYRQFLSAIENGNKDRVTEADHLIKNLIDHSYIVTEYDHIKQNTQFRLRVTHHDTKISNILFDPAEKGICVIDLDTVMPGYFISDAGDMMRTYLSPVSEEENDFDIIEVRDDVYRAVVQGYADEMKGELTPMEKGSFFYAGKFMIYMQAIRFLTDYLNDDVYYGASYPKHNFFRAGNQAVLLQRLTEKESILK